VLFEEGEEGEEEPRAVRREGGRELLFISISSTNHTRPVYRREWRRTTSGEEGGREGGREGGNE